MIKLINSLVPKLSDAFGKTVKRNNVHPKEDTNGQELVDRGTKEKVEKVDFPCVFQTLLFNNIHKSSRNL